MAWQKLTTSSSLGSETEFNTDNYTSNKFQQIMIHSLSAPSGYDKVGFNNNTNTVYAQRTSVDGLADATSVSRPYNDVNVSDATTPVFVVMYLINITGEEKLAIGFQTQQLTAGATTAPQRIEMAWKFVPSPDADVTRVDYYNSGSNNYVADSNITVIGGDVTEEAILGNNAQSGSRFEATDTRKIYYWNGASWTEEA